MLTKPSDQPRRRRSPLTWALQARWRVQRGLTMGGQVCVIDRAGHVLLVRHGYRPGWHFPGGGVETGEYVVDAAMRELEEETGVVARGPPVLHGIFNHVATFPGDHIVLYVLRDYIQSRTPVAGFEIAEQGFFPPATMPAATNAGTRRRIAEIFDGIAITTYW